MPRTNETRHIEWHETCKCKCRLFVTINNVGITIYADVMQRIDWQRNMWYMIYLES